MHFSTELILLYNSVPETLLMIYTGLSRRITKSRSLWKIWNVNCCQFSAEISLRHLEVIKEMTSLWRRQDCTGWDWLGPYLVLADFAVSDSPTGNYLGRDGGIWAFIWSRNHCCFCTAASPEGEWKGVSFSSALAKQFTSSYYLRRKLTALAMAACMQLCF